MPETNILTAITSVLTGMVSVVLLYLGAKRLGLTDLQKAVSSETERLILAMKERIAVLEARHHECAGENEDLKAQVRELQARVDGLEGKLADLILHTPLPRAPSARRPRQANKVKEKTSEDI